MESSHTSGTTNEPKTPQEDDDLRGKIPTDRIAASGAEDPPSPSPSKAQESDATGTTNNDASNHHTEKNDLETQCPPKQVMERSAEEGDARYRIPSHVFSRANTGNRMGWSTNSNESLFSIQMGNMSFTKDHLQWMSKSELFDVDPSIRPSMELASNQQSTARQSVEVDRKGGNIGDRIGDHAEAAAVANVVMEDEAEKKSPPKLPEPDRKRDHQNLAGAASFAFPILPGQVDKNGSVSAWPNAKKQQMHASHQPSKEAPPKQSNHVKLGSEEKQASGDQSPNQKQAAASSTTVDQWRIWSCFSCCPFR